MTPLSSTGLPSEFEHLLREMRHQYRNDLALVCALLELELLHAPESERRRLRSSLARIRCLSHVYACTGVDAQRPVAAEELAKKLVNDVLTSHGFADAACTIHGTLTTPITGKQALYLGLIITELALHVCACACARGVTPVPELTFTATPTDMTLAIANATCTSSGICSGMEPLSREIIIGLVEHSLKGRVELEPCSPFRLCIHCPHRARQ